MSNELTKDLTGQFETTMAKIAETAARYGALEATTPPGYKLVTRAIADCRGMRTAVDRRRKELNSDALEYQRTVNAVAVQLTGAIQEIEGPLKARKAAVDDAKAAEKEAKAAAEREAQLAIIREAQEKLEAERARQRAVEEARIAAEREELEKERRALAIERAAQEEDNRKAAEVSRAIIAAEEDRLANQRAVERQAAAAERAELEAERAALAKSQAAAAEAERERARIEAEEIAKAAAAFRRLELAPEIEKLSAWADQIEAVRELGPNVPEGAAYDACAAADEALIVIIERLRRVCEIRGGK